jgi:hypothetical protein
MPDRLAHRDREFVEVGDHIELRVGTLPLAEHAQQLREEDAQARIGGLGAYRLGQLGERSTRVARAKGLLGVGSGIGHGSVLGAR